VEELTDDDSVSSTEVVLLDELEDSIAAVDGL
jgi:hypothetical protein